MSKKVTEKKESLKEEYISYSVGLFLQEALPKLRVYNYSDILKFEDLGNKLKELTSSFQSKTKELLDTHGITGELNSNDEKYDIVNKEYSDLIVGSSELKLKDIQLFSSDEFSKAFDGVGFNIQESILLSKCLIKK